MKRSLLVLCVLAAIPFLIITCRSSDKEIKEEAEGFDAPRTVDPNPSPAHLSPQQSLKSFRLPKGYHMELVASEPMIKEPVAIAWDGNGRMYVAEMRTYMQDADATGEQKPISRISLLEDTDNDGKMDKSS